MIRCIAAIDNKSGLATDQGIPWQLPGDQQYFRRQTIHGLIVMGYRTYLEFKSALPDRQNFVVTSDAKPLRTGFTPVLDVAQFLELHKNESLWIIGGAGLFAQTIQFASELYLTQIDGDFHCTKFFPEYRTQYQLLNSSAKLIDNNISYNFQIWKRKQ